MHSTETALINVSDNLLKAIDEKSASLLVLLDMSKAFDSLNHDLLLEKLRRLGLKASAVFWFSSYLSSRYQRLRYEDSVSELLPLTNGVPQGSILGPVLFTIYINYLISAITHSQHTFDITGNNDIDLLLAGSSELLSLGTGITSAIFHALGKEAT